MLPTVDAGALSGRDVVVFTDHDAPDVAPMLAEGLRSPARFVGVMGSRRHVGHHVEALRSMGVTDDEITRVRSPLGLDLGGRDPRSIALSIAAGSSPTRTVGTEGGSTAEMGSALRGDGNVRAAAAMLFAALGCVAAAALPLPPARGRVSVRPTCSS